MKVAILGAAHVHVNAYLTHLGEDLYGVYDHDPGRGNLIAKKFGVPFYDSAQSLMGGADAAIICSETIHHEELIAICVQAGAPILCEKPIAMDRRTGERIHQLVKSHPFMTALPCRYSPMWNRVKQRVQSGEIGDILGVAATNHGKCPGGWFMIEELGGGAILDHTVHCADLINQLGFGSPVAVQVSHTNKFHSTEVEDAAMATFDFPQGKFVTLDSSWSRPASYPTWGDLTLNIVGDLGVIEADLFAQSINLTQGQCSLSSYSSNLEKALLADFLSGPPYMTGIDDGLRADAWAWLALESL